MTHQRQTDPDELDELYRLLANRRRRSVLAYFRDAESDVATLQEIADEVSDDEYGGEEQTLVQLHHSALPRLDRADVLEYDERSNTVRYRGHPELESLNENVARI